MVTRIGHADERDIKKCQLFADIVFRCIFGFFEESYIAGIGIKELHGGTE